MDANLEGDIPAPNKNNLCPSDSDIDGEDDPDAEGMEYLNDILAGLAEHDIVFEPQSHGIEASPRRLGSLYRDFSIIGGPKKWRNEYDFEFSKHGLTAKVKYGYDSGFDARLKIRFNWSLWPWGYIDLWFMVYGYIEANTWFHLQIKFQWEKAFKLLGWSKTFSPRIAGIAIVIRPFFVLQARFETLPFVISVGMNCDYKREFGIGYWMKTKRWFRKFQSGKIESSKTTKNDCNEYYEIGEEGNQMATMCDPYDLGLNIYVEPIIGVALYEIVACWIRVEFKIPLRIKIPETDNSICSYDKFDCDSTPLKASFKLEPLELSLYFGYKLQITFWRILGLLIGLIAGRVPGQIQISDYTGFRIGGPWMITKNTITLGCIELDHLFPGDWIENYIEARCCATPTTTVIDRIRCGEKRTGSIEAYEKHRYEFIVEATDDYQEVWLESELSDFQTHLYLQDMDDNELISCNNCNNHGNEAGDLTLTDYLSPGNSYFIDIGGYNGANGDYVLELVCVHDYISCNEEVEGEIEPFTSKTYKFTMPSNIYETMYFESCGSSYDTTLTLKDMQLNQLTSGDNNNVHGDYCGLAGDLGFEEYVSVDNSYLLEIGGYLDSYGSYKLSLTCNNDRKLIGHLELNSFRWTDVFGNDANDPTCHTPQFHGLGWCAETNDNDDSTLKVELPGLFEIGKVVTWGGVEWPEWVKSYILSYSFDDNTVNKQTFTANNITNQWSAAENAIDPAIAARQLSLTPIDYEGWKTMRVEAYGQQILIQPLSLNAFSWSDDSYSMQIKLLSKNNDDNLCVETNSNDNVGLWSNCDGNINQQWIIGDTDSDGFYTIKSAANGLCLDPNSAGDITDSINNGDFIYTNPCHSGENQKWKIDETMIRNKANDQSKCLRSARDGINNLHIWDCGDDNSKYIFVDRSLSFQSAEQYCIDNYGTHLASIHNADDQNEAYSICTSSRSCWMGLNDRDREGTWKWTDGSNYDYSYWNPGEPNNAGGEDCTHYDGKGGKWNDLQCYRSLRFLCNYPATNQAFEAQIETPGDADQCRTPQVDGSAWCAENNYNDNSYLEVDLGNIYSIHSVTTYGRKFIDEWVTSYTLQFSVDGFIWNNYGHTLSGNSDRNTPRQNLLSYQLIAKYLRFIPNTYNNWKSLRVEAHGHLALNPIYRYYAYYLDRESGDSLYTLDRDEIGTITIDHYGRWGYQYQGIGFYLLPSHSHLTTLQDVVPLHRYYQYDDADTLLTTDPNEIGHVDDYTAAGNNGYWFETTIGHCYSSSDYSGSVPLYRLYHSDLRNHFYTVDEHEKDIYTNEYEYILEGIECYVMAKIATLNDIRLSGTSQGHGRVEIYDGNLRWATVCGDGFGVNEAKVICRQLGFSGNGANPIHNFGGGSGDIVLSNLQCDGTESNIMDCNYTQEHDCGHDQDVGVECKKSGDHRIIQTLSSDTRPSTLSWIELSGELKHISIGSDGTIMGVDVDDKIYRYDGEANGISSPWTQITTGSRLKQISVGNANNIWGVNAAGNIYKYNNGGWQQISGGLKHVSVASDGTVWGVASDDTIWKYNGGNSWAHISGHQLSQISVGSATEIIGINDANQLYKYNGDDNSWQLIDTNSLSFKYVDISTNGDIWAIDINDKIHRYEAGIWSLINGELTQVESDNGIVIGVNSNNEIFKATDPVITQQKWELLAEQNTETGGYFGSEVKSANIGNEGDPLFSKIAGITDPTIYQNDDGKYKFKLVYTPGDGSNDQIIEWTQSSWLTDNVDIATDVDIIHAPPETTSYVGQLFKGLAYTDRSACYIDGNGNSHNDWWNCVCSTTAYGSGIPAYNAEIATRMRLSIGGYQTLPVINTSQTTFTWSDGYSHTGHCDTPHIDGIAWCAANNDNPGSYLQVNLGNLYHINTVITLGRRGSDAQWVTSYTFEYSMDGKTWTRNGIYNPLIGNKDSTTESRTNFDSQIVAQFVRFIPNEYHNWKSMRVELIGHLYPETNDIRLIGTGSAEYEGRVEIYNGFQWGTICNNGYDKQIGQVICRSLGFSGRAEDVTLINTNIEQGASPYGAGTGPILITRLHCEGDEANLMECEYSQDTDNCDHNEDIAIKCEPSTSYRLTQSASSADDDNIPLIVDLGGHYSIDSVITKGIENVNEWVISYNLYFSFDGIAWKSDGINNPLSGNSDSTNAKQNYFASPIRATYLKFEAVTYYGHKSMRIEVIGQSEDDHSMVSVASSNSLNYDDLIDLDDWKQSVVQIKQHPYFKYFAFSLIILLIINIVYIMICIGNKSVSKQYKYNKVAVESEYSE